MTPPSLVYFKITSVESDPASANGGAKNHPAYYGYGRHIDPAGTKMVQTGLEQSRMPPGRGVGMWVGGGAAVLAPTPTPSSFTPIHSTIPPGMLYTLISCPRGSGKRMSALWAAERCGVHVVETNCYDFAGETDTKTETSLCARFDHAAACAPCMFLVGNVDALARKAVVLETGQGEEKERGERDFLHDLFADLLTSHHYTGYPTMVVATTGDIERLPTSVLGCFRHERLECTEVSSASAPRDLRNLTSGSPLAPDVSLRSLATQTATLVAKDLIDLVARAGLAALERVTDGREEEDLRGTILNHTVVRNMTNQRFDNHWLIGRLT
ncbi:hypothetical protein BC938DRAFT_473415 [Jimgerdemannia flammicorona]|uniref:Uncharacterized protein n=1 Tax=Jimgerdemannia flammicorona TaxID=994334 RepID=A0A433Q3Z8_9FUNG|nr:hypothetical protein BC938DRAFT_473415 [Jimgerdemannia flammicorona]